MQRVSCLAIVGLLFCLIVAMPAWADGPVWSCNGPFGGRVRALAVSPNYPLDRLIFAGADKAGLFRSVNAGDSWQVVTGLPADLTISSIVISPAFSRDGTLFVSTIGGGVFKSWDGGVTWSAWSGGLSTLSVAQLAISPAYATDQTLIAATDRGVYLSTSAGKNWSAVGPSVTTLSVSVGQATSGDSPETQLIAFAGTVLGLYASSDGGRTWRPTALGGIPVTAIALSPNYASDQTILVGTLRGARLSTDGGITWGEARLEGQTIHSVLFSPEYATDRTLFLGTGDGIYVSRDGGTTWTRCAGVVDAVYALNAPPNYAMQPLLLAGTEQHGVLVSADRGASWTPKNKGIANLPFEAVAVSPNFVADRTVFVGGTSGVWKSTDDGLNWQATSLDFVEVRALACSPRYALDGKVYAVTNEGLFISDDRGERWRGASTGLDVINATDLAFGAGNELWIATAGGGVYYSANGGASWVRRSAGLQSLYVTAIEWLGAEGDKVYLLAGTWGAGVFTSNNGGLSWAPASSGPNTPLIRTLTSVEGYAGQRICFAGTTAGAFRSFDRGRTWEFTGLLGRDVRSIAPHPDYVRRPNLYIGTEFDGVFRSTNGGLTWSPLNEGLDTRQIRGLALGTTPADVVLFAATAGSVWRYGSLPESPRHIIRFPLVFKVAR